MLLLNEDVGPVFSKSAIILLVIFGGLTDRSGLRWVERLKSETDETFVSKIK